MCQDYRILSTVVFVYSYKEQREIYECIYDNNTSNIVDLTGPILMWALDKDVLDLILGRTHLGNGSVWVFWIVAPLVTYYSLCL